MLDENFSCSFCQGKQFQLPKTTTRSSSSCVEYTTVDPEQLSRALVMRCRNKKKGGKRRRAEPRYELQLGGGPCDVLFLTGWQYMLIMDCILQRVVAEKF